MTEYYMEVDRVINVMGPHLEMHPNGNKPPSKSKATEDIEMKTSTGALIQQKDPSLLS